MSNEKKDQLKKLLKKIELDSPSRDFTKIVMKEVEADTRQEVVVSPFLKELLVRNPTPRPSASFATNVMSRVDQLKSVEPIISKKAWYRIAAVTIVSLLLFAYVSPANVSSKGLPFYVTGIGDAIGTFFSGVPFLYPAVIVAISSLLMLDYFLRSPKKTLAR